MIFFKTALFLVFSVYNLANFAFQQPVHTHKKQSAKAASAVAKSDSAQ